MKPAAFLLTTLLLTQILTHPATSAPIPPANQIAQADLDDGTLTPQQVQQTAKNITVRITTEKNGGSGVIIAQKGGNYLILTNAHVVRRATKIQIQAPDGQKYQATSIDGGFDAKYDLALLQFTSKAKYTLANLSSVSGSPLEPERTIYSAGFPFDSKNIRISSGQISQLSDLPFNDGTQIGYVTNKGEKGIRQGMSGGAIFDAQGNLLGINTVGVAPILPDYTYNDGSKPLAKLKAQYARANWGIPIYNFLTNVKADILYDYANLPKVERQVTPTGYMAKLNIKARQMTVRIENSSGNGSGVIVAKQGSTYYVLTAKHVLQNPETKQVYTNPQIVTYDQDRQNVSGTVVAEGADLAVVKFSSNNNYSIAWLGKYSQNNFDVVFVGGFPGRLSLNSPLWQWQLNPGFVKDREQGKFDTQDNQSFSNGYDLIYSSISYGGMSGGPVLDVAGNVIGIHGKKESADLNSLGISIDTFIDLATKLEVAPNLLYIAKTNPVGLNSTNRQNVLTTMQNIPQPQQGDNGERWLAYGNQLYRTRQYDRAVIAFDQAIAKDQRLLGNYGKALSLMSPGKYQLSEGAINQAIVAVSPNQFNKYYYLWKYKGLILTRLEKYDEAIKVFDIAIKIEPNDLKLLNHKAFVLQKKGQYSEAIVVYNEIIRKQPEIYAYLGRGNAKSAMGNRQEAIADYDQAIVLNAKYAQAYIGLGNANLALGNKKEAIADYGRAIAINPKYAQGYVGRGNANLALGNKEAAIIDIERAIALNPKSAFAYSIRANIKSAFGDKKAALVDIERAITLDSKLAIAYNSRSVLKFELGDNSASMTDIDRAISISSDFASAYRNRGFLKIIIGRERDALPDLDRAIKLDPKIGESYACRGFIREMFGDKQGAISDYRQAIQVDPQSIQKWRKQAELIRTYNAISYQKYQQMIQKLEAGVRFSQS